jgi:hypothetical protein
MEYALQVFDASADIREIILNDEGKKRVLQEWKLFNHDEVLIEGTEETSRGRARYTNQIQ